MADAGTVYIIDDDQSLRSALDTLFRSVGLRTRPFGDAASFLRDPAQERPGCLLLDIRLPELNGLDFQASLATRGIDLPVVLMTGHGDIPMSVRGMKAGAVDFLTKPFREQDMLDAVSAALARDRDQREAAGAVDALRGLHEALTPRERQVMALVVAGKMNKQVAGDLSISEVTVKIHRGAVMRKMGAASLAELVRMAGVLGTNTSG